MSHGLLDSRFEDRPDWQLIVGILAIIYLAYIASGMLLGFPLRGQINAMGDLTFYVAMFAMLSLALNLHWGYTGLFNIGIVAFMAIAIYTMAVLVKLPLSQDPTAQIGGLGLPILVGVVAGVLAATVFGFVISLPALRLRADYLAIVTIAFSEIMRFVFLTTEIKKFTLFGTETGLGGGSGLVFNVPAPMDWLVGSLGLRGPYLEFVTWFGTTLGIGNPKAVVDNLVYSLLLVLFVVAFYWLLQRIGRSPFGRVLKAIREDEDVARALGKNTDWFKMQSFMVGCALMGLAGILWMYDQGAINPNNFRPRITFYVWIALIIGGAGSNTGSVLGGAIFAALLFQGPLYAKNLVTTALQMNTAPRTFAGVVGPMFAPLTGTGSLALDAVLVMAFLAVAVGILAVTPRVARTRAGRAGDRLDELLPHDDGLGGLPGTDDSAVWGSRLVRLAGLLAFLALWTVLAFAGGNLWPLLAYALSNINQLQIVFMGVVLVWLMHNRPEGLLGHRTEEASAVDLTDRPVVSDGGFGDE